MPTSLIIIRHTGGQQFQVARPDGKLTQPVALTGPDAVQVEGRPDSDLHDPLPLPKGMPRGHIDSVLVIAGPYGETDMGIPCQHPRVEWLSRQFHQPWCHREAARGNVVMGSRSDLSSDSVWHQYGRKKRGQQIGLATPEKADQRRGVDDDALNPHPPSPRAGFLA